MAHQEKDIKSIGKRKSLFLYLWKVQESNIYWVLKAFVSIEGLNGEDFPQSFAQNLEILYKPI